MIATSGKVKTFPYGVTSTPCDVYTRGVYKTVYKGVRLFILRSFYYLLFSLYFLYTLYTNRKKSVFIRVYAVYKGVYKV